MGSWPALFVDPDNIDDIAAGLIRIDEDHELRAQLCREGPVRAAEFSVNASAAISAAAVGFEAPRAGLRAGDAHWGRPDPARGSLFIEC